MGLNFVSRSVFPNGIDTFPELFDLPSDKVNDANRLTVLKGKASLDTNEQNEIKALTAKLQDYMITPEQWNRITDCMTALETFFDRNVRGYILQKQEEWRHYVDSFRFVGNWTNQTKYSFQNLVNYRGHLFLVLKDVVADNNHTPDLTPDTYRQVAFKGDKGDVGLNATFKGDWNGSTTYHLGDAVFKDGIVFVAKNDSTGKEPNINSANWFPYPQSIIVGNSKPQNLHPAISYLEVYN